VTGCIHTCAMTSAMTHSYMCHDQFVSITRHNTVNSQSSLLPKRKEKKTVVCCKRSPAKDGVVLQKDLLQKSPTTTVFFCNRSPAETGHICKRALFQKSPTKTGLLRKSHVTIFRADPPYTHTHTNTHTHIHTYPHTHTYTHTHTH